MAARLQDPSTAIEGVTIIRAKPLATDLALLEAGRSRR
jgi:hypothetical protein